MGQLCQVRIPETMTLIEWIMAWLTRLFGWKDPAEYVPQAPKLPQDSTSVPSSVSTTNIPEPVKIEAIMSKRETLYDVAYKCIGRDMSPLDRAPDSLACMESLDGVFFEAFGEHLVAPENRLSTRLGYRAMAIDPRLRILGQEETPLPGDIVISPSGYSTIGTEHGHTGIRGKTTYMSNDSTDGKWKANYNLPNWKLVFHDTLGFPVFHFRVVG